MELHTFEFQVVILDCEGHQVERGTGVSRSFTETLPGNIQLEMVEIPGGPFLMGATEKEGDIDERPQHWVTVPSFFMGKFQVTQAQWRAVASLPPVEKALQTEPSHFQGDTLPVEQVTWFDALEFCARLTRETGKTYRLPSEAEWEYACRAGTTSPFSFGETITSDFVNFDGICPHTPGVQGEYRAQTVPVGSLGFANEFGLYDMHGNVWEWCYDTWHSSYEGAPTDGSAWKQNGNDLVRVLRGGSWDYAGYGCRSAFRDRGKPEIASPFNGLRVVAMPASP